MTRSLPPATVVICHRLAEDTTPEQLAARDALATKEGVTVTWAVSLGLPGGLGAGVDRGVPIRAVADDADWWTSRGVLRDRLKRVAHELPGIDTLVVGDGRAIDHRDVLRDHGIRVVCSDRFSDAPRGSRRPAPAGWACRSLCWGLWEVALSTPHRGMMDRLTGRAGDPRPLPGGLTVLASGDRPGATPLDRLVHLAGRWAMRGEGSSVVLGDVARLVATAGGGGAGSVLRAA